MLGNFVFQNTMIYMVFHSQTGALNLYRPTVNQVEIQNLSEPGHTWSEV